MAVDINNDLKKAADKTNVYKTYKQYKQNYDELKKRLVVQKNRQINLFQIN